MSQRGPWGRLTPRWSWRSQALPPEPGFFGLPWLRAFEWRFRSWVLVKPPLLRSGFRPGLTPSRLPVLSPVIVQPVGSPKRLWPWETIVPKQFGPVPDEPTVLPAMMLFWTVGGLSAWMPPPSPPPLLSESAVLLVTVTLFIRSEP